MVTDTSHNLKIVGPKNKFPKVTLVEPNTSEYVFLGLSVDRRLPFTYGFESGKKSRVLTFLKEQAKALSCCDGVLDCTVFRALIIPPGRGKYLEHRPEVKIAHFDIVMLLEFTTKEAAQSFLDGPDWQNILAQVTPIARDVMSLTLTNTRKIGPVDHSKQGVFLFNYFYADKLKQNLSVWEYTAGWFQDQTGLDNSTLLVPNDESASDYTVINHCRWDSLKDIVPSLLFKRSFHNFVLANFEANKTAPIPILYKLA